MPQFASAAAIAAATSSQANSSNFIQLQTSGSYIQKEIESLKKNNQELQIEIEKYRTSYNECNYQMMSSNMKLNNCKEQLEQLIKEKLEYEKRYKELRNKYEEKCFTSNQTIEDRSLFCDECNFEVKSQVALFIHKLNHHFDSSAVPRHLQLSTRSFTTMPDDSIRFKYKCRCCEIDAEREFARHEIYVHIYQFHTFDVPFKCKLCFLYFTSKTYLNDHLAEKHSQHHITNLTNSIRQGKGKRKSLTQTNLDQNHSFGDEPLHQPTILVDLQLNSTLPLNIRTESMPNSELSNKRLKINSESTSNGTSKEMNELLNQLVGDTIGQDLRSQTHQLSTSQKQANECSACPSPSITTCTSSITSPSVVVNENFQQIMNELDVDSSLNCKYPGCKFVATTKNHLKFHISAHLMSKYKCPYCTFVGNRIIEIKRHILKSAKHADQHVYLCTDCDFATDCEKTFRDHYTRYHNSTADISVVIERMFANESNKVGQNMVSAFKPST
ncbi:hypothetical protein RDWZM_006426 [Blomia tropicalis]|uniref:C2H2-type domain-containing protein n=1 Tax=Blomia tropicalis TaxID=40697 RepID=A0A9Q0RNB1_BLOTA|nr:hypothetical protein RDWZM_006426 [Blomia tropicalis]